MGIICFLKSVFSCFIRIYFIIYPYNINAKKIHIYIQSNILITIIKQKHLENLLE